MAAGYSIITISGYNGSMRLHLRQTPQTDYAFKPDYASALARHFALPANGLAQSHFQLLESGASALAWRIALIDNAQHCIDAQYYSWHLDKAGLVLIDKLIAAADRGVRVRILLDDIHTFGFDRHIATLNKHPRIEVRLFNPFTYRSSFRLFRLLELVFKLSRLNHRMHNKLLLVDNLFAVLGGRNIADEYFGLNEQFTFHDLDLLITGASIEELSSSFDLYWNHRYSFTARRLIALRTPRRALNRLRRQLKQQLARNANALITIQDMATALMQPVTGAETALALHFPCLADARVFYDSPAFDTHGGEHTVDALYQALQNTRQSLLIVSAYFVPDERLLNALLQHAARGTRIRIFTNSLASVDVTAVFSGYQRCRQQLLAAGVELFEYRAYRPRISHFAPRCSLHMKSIVYDARTLYVGTFNLDPRSTSLNTEIGLLIDCPMLAQQLVDSQTRALEQAHYWQLRLDTTHTLCWHSADATLTRQPARSWRQRLLNQVLALLPIRRHL